MQAEPPHGYLSFLFWEIGFYLALKSCKHQTLTLFSNGNDFGKDSSDLSVM